MTTTRLIVCGAALIATLFWKMASLETRQADGLSAAEIMVRNSRVEHRTRKNRLADVVKLDRGPRELGR